MSVRHIGNGVTVILLLLCALLAVLIYKQWESYSLETPNTEITKDTSYKKQANSNIFLGNQSKTILITQFSEILARPLFTEGRLPEEVPEPEQALVQQVGLPKLKLEGVVISPESRVAVVRDLTNNSLLRLSEGMIHTGWRLTKVNTAEAILERGDETHKLPLELIKKPNVKTTTSRFRLPPKNTQAKTRPGAKSQ